MPPKGTKRGPRRQLQRAAAAPTQDNTYLLRRTLRHLADLERTNYTESTATSFLGHGKNDNEPDEIDETPAAVGARLEAMSAVTGSGGAAGGKKKRSTQNVRSLLLYRKTVQTLIEESNLAKGLPNTPIHNYLTAKAEPSRYPPLQLCSVCGYKPNYACMRCGLKLCDRGCREVHDEARCERR